MKVFIWDWAGAARDTIKTAGYEHGQKIEDCNPFDVAKKLFDAGLNVMLFRGTEGDVVVAADTRRFGTR